jgi:tetratricopeptide (TPR) repeat protein
MKHELKILLAKCRQLDEQQSWDSAIALLSDALAKKSFNSQLHYERGLRYEAQGRFSEAYDDFSDAIRIDPSVFEHFCARGRVLCNGIGHFPEAISDFDSAIELAPDSPEPYQHLSVCYLSLDDLKNATRYALKALDLNLSDALSFYCLARCRIANNEFGEAEKALLNAVRLDAKKVIYWVALGDCLNETQSPLDAIDCYEKAIKLERSANIFIKLAKVHIDLGRMGEALKYLEVASNHELSPVEQVLVDGYRGNVGYSCDS